jgi:phosphate:Na+ symporter
MEPFSAIAFLGALAIFMYGIRISRIGIQLLAGDRLRSLVASLTDNRFSALVTGILVTMILQSSTATTVMLVGFAATGAISLIQAMGVLLGADIGTTFVVILLSIRKIADFSLLMLAAGVVLDILSKKKRSRYISMVILGFGFVFFGMQLMIHTTSPLRENHLLVEIFQALGENPSYAFFAAAVFTALVQNSATTLGLTIALAFSDLLDLKGAIPIVLGANVGTCASSLLNSIGGGPAARRVALSHLFFKLTGALLAMAFLSPFADLITATTSYFPLLRENAAPQVAAAHVGFNLLLSLLFLPFIRQGAWLIQKLVPEPSGAGEKAFGPKYLDLKSLETPALAFANAKREILRMAEIAHEMFQDTIHVFEKDDREMIASIEERDDKIDILDREIKFYLAKISQEDLNPEQARMQLNLVAITSDVEEICDILNKNILELAEKKIQKGRRFSAEGWKEIADIHFKVLENFQLMVSTLTTEDEALARKAVRHEKHLAFLEDRYREAHLQRLHKGLKETIETSSIHLDLLANFRRINSKLTAIVKAAFPGKEI